jgi:hypothetical protein
VRQITLTVKIKPGKKRNMAAASIRCESKLPGLLPTSTALFFGRKDGKLVAVESDPDQDGLFDGKGDRKLRPIRPQGGE